MSQSTPYRGNDPTVGINADESPDLRTIKRDMQQNKQFEQMSQQYFTDVGHFRREFNLVAMAAQDWDNATSLEKFRVLRILVRRFGRHDTFLLTLMAAPKSYQDWIVKFRKRKDTEKTDGGKRRKDSEREHWDYIIGREVYMRIKAGESKTAAIAAVKEDYRLGKPIEFPAIGDFPPLIMRREIRHLPADDGKNNGMDKILNRFRQAVRKRGYVDPYAALVSTPFPKEPDLKLSDIPGRGRPKGK